MTNHRAECPLAQHLTCCADNPARHISKTVFINNSVFFITTHHVAAPIHLTCDGKLLECDDRRLTSLPRCRSLQLPSSSCHDPLLRSRYKKAQLFPD
jgi:hypothetical protein